jgi:hypothetical protein
MIADNKEKELTIFFTALERCSYSRWSSAPC